MKTIETREAPAFVPSIGTRPIRHDGVDKVTGRARYGVDATMPDLLHGKVLRSPHAHARIIAIDTRRAEALPGVHAVITAKDFPTPGLGRTTHEEYSLPVRHKVRNIIAHEKVLYHGHAVAAVAASDPQTAEEALRLIDVRYEPLPAVLDVREAMRADAPILLTDLPTGTNVAQHHHAEEGDVERGFADASLVIEREFTFSTVHQGYIEPHNATAFWGVDGQVVIECSSQGHFVVRDEVAGLLQWPASKIRVVPMEIGGGFGAKTTTWLEPLAVVLSRKSGHPVKMTMSRSEVLLASGPTSGGYARVKMGVTKSGRITALECYFALESGAFPPAPVGGAVGSSVPLYDLTCFRVDGDDVVVNKPKTTAYRAPGAPHAAFAIESVADEICTTLGIDPIDFRLENAPHEGSLRADGRRLPRVGMIECLEAARASEHWRTPLQQRPGFRRGRGVGAGVWGNAGGLSSVTIHLHRDGTVTMLTGSVDIGGTRTSTAMQLADTLGIPVDRIKPAVADTDTVPPAMLTGGSRVTFATGYAAHRAGLELKKTVAAGLALAWDVEPASVSESNGVYSSGKQTATLAEAAAQLAALAIDCTATVSTLPPAVGPSYAVHIADVEVDEETGKTTVLRYTAIQDVGRAIYPPYVEGQMQGGAMQGIGWALSEGYWYDADGRLKNATLLDYRMPTTLDVPMIDTIMVEVANPAHPYGVRGVGEVPIVPPLATIANAIHAATGARVRDLPITPARLSSALAARPAR